MKKQKRRLDYSVVFSFLAIIIIIIGLIFATIIRFNYDETNKKTDFNETATTNIEVAKQNALTYIDFLEASYQANRVNNPDYILPDNIYITDVDTNLGLGLYPTSVNLFVVAGQVQSGTITISEYTFEYQNGILIEQY